MVGKRELRLSENVEMRESRNVKESNSVIQQSMENPKSLSKLNKNELISCCIGLVASDLVSLKLFDDKKYFKRLISYESEFNLNLNSTEIIKKISLAARLIKDQIKSDIVGKLVSFKFDIAARDEVKFVTASVYYIKDFKLINKCVGMLNLGISFHPKVLKKFVEKILINLEIDVNQVYSTTVDSKEPGTMEKEIFEQIEDVIRETTSVATHCPVSIIEIVAIDVLKVYSKELEQCRQIVSAMKEGLQNSTFTQLIPSSDSPADWKSTIKMLESLKNTLPCAMKMKTNIPRINWDFLGGLLKAFSPLMEFLKNVQKDNCISGDFYRELLECELALEENQNCEYAGVMLTFLRKRKRDLLKSEKFAAAVYLDPRFNYANSTFLNDEQKEEALTHILSTYKLIEKKVDNEERIKIDQAVSLAESNSTYSSRLERQVAQMHMSTELLGENDLRQKLNSFSMQPRIPFQTNLLDFWKLKCLQEPYLKPLVEVILAVPINQITMDRTFDSLKFMLTNLNQDISNMHDLLIVRSNMDSLEEIKYPDDS